MGSMIINKLLNYYVYLVSSLYSCACKPIIHNCLGLLPLSVRNGWWVHPVASELLERIECTNLLHSQCPESSKIEKITEKTYTSTKKVSPQSFYFLVVGPSDDTSTLCLGDSAYTPQLKHFYLCEPEKVNQIRLRLQQRL